MGMFDDLVPQSSVQAGPALQQPKQDKSALDWVGDTFGPNGNLRGSSIGGVMQGMADPVVGAVQTVANLPGVKSLFGDLVNDAVKSKDKEYEAARSSAGRDGFDAARLTGNVASPVNLAIAAKVPLAAGGMARVGQGALVGGGSGAMEPVIDSENFWSEKAKQTGVGAAGGAIATPILGRIGDAVARRSAAGVQPVSQSQINNTVASALSETGQSIHDIPQATLQRLQSEVQQALSNGQTLDAASLLRRADFESVGIDPLLGQITRDPMQYAREMNLRGVAGVGDPIAARLNSQALALRNGIGQYGADAAEAYPAGSQIRDVLSNTDEALQRHVSALYTQARNDAGKDLDIPLQGLAQDYANILRDFGDRVPSGVRTNFEDLGLLSGNQNRVFNFEEADRLMKVINQNQSNDPAVNAALSQLRQSVRGAATSVDASGGPFAPAVAAAAERFRLHDAVPALEAASRGNVAPDDFVRRFIINGKAEDVHGLSQVLQQADPAAYQQARSQLGATLQRAAFGENTAGDKVFSQERFNKALRELGEAKMSAFFSPGEIDRIRTIGRVGAYITSQPAGSAVNNSNTASAAMNMLNRIPMPSSLRSVVSGVNTLATSSQNGTNARNALAAQVPSVRSGLTPEQENILAMILGGGAAVAGAASSGAVRQ